VRLHPEGPKLFLQGVKRDSRGCGIHLERPKLHLRGYPKYLKGPKIYP